VLALLYRCLLGSVPDEVRTGGVVDSFVEYCRHFGLRERPRLQHPLRAEIVAELADFAPTPSSEAVIDVLTQLVCSSSTEPETRVEIAQALGHWVHRRERPTSQLSTLAARFFGATSLAIAQDVPEPHSPLTSAGPGAVAGALVVLSAEFWAASDRPADLGIEIATTAMSASSSALAPLRRSASNSAAFLSWHPVLGQQVRDGCLLICMSSILSPDETVARSALGGLSVGAHRVKQVDGTSLLAGLLACLEHTAVSRVRELALRARLAIDSIRGSLRTDDPVRSAYVAALDRIPRAPGLDRAVRTASRRQQVQE